MKFISLNLEAKTKNELLVKNYLEEHASEVLADKINNGVQIIVTDDAGEHTVINKKTLSGFWAFASAEARKLQTGHDRACELAEGIAAGINGRKPQGTVVAVEDETVFGWAVHYFEEESIEGDLYNLDGTRFTRKTKPPKTDSKPKKTEDKPAAPKSKPAQNNGQMNLFDLADDSAESENEADEEGSEEDDDIE